jgi:hypothetical protein
MDKTAIMGTASNKKIPQTPLTDTEPRQSSSLPVSLIIKSIALVEQTQNKTETGEVG